MTRDEAKEFLDLAFVRLPGIWEWLQRNSPDVSETLEAWSETLESISLEEAVYVLKRWSNGTLEPPKGYLREVFHLEVLREVKRDRNERWEAKNRNNVLQQTKAPKLIDECPGLEAFIVKLNLLKYRYDSGVISEADRDAEIEKLVKAEHERVDGKNRSKSDTSLTQ